MEQILQNNAVRILSILSLVIVIVYVIVRIHEWILRIAVTGLFAVLAVIFYLQYQGYSIIEWKKIAADSERWFKLGKEKLREKGSEHQKKLPAKVAEKLVELSEKTSNLGNLPLPDKNPKANPKSRDEKRSVEKKIIYPDKKTFSLIEF